MKDSLKTRLPSRQRRALGGGRSAPRRSTVHPRIVTAEVLEERLLLSAVDSTNVATLTVQPFTDANSTAEPYSTASPSGYTPAQVRHAYGFDNIFFANGTVPGDGAGTTIAIVNAYDHPYIASDLQQFSLAFGLPQANFTKVNQTGGTTYPPPNSAWATEIALDVQWAHAIAPAANILLVEANSNSFSDLFAAVNYAKSQPGVVVVSMSWGGSEFSFESLYDSTFTTPLGHAGVTFVASSGDNGSPLSYPSASPNVLSVGGTTLNLDTAGNWISETGWSGSGGGISAYENKPAYQIGVTQSLLKRTNPDVAYNSSPSTGFPVYDTYNNPVSSPWGKWGGTSAAAPQWAALMAIVAQGRALEGKAPLDGPSETLPLLYSMPASNFHDIISGSSNGSPKYSSAAGYDLVTGRGSPYANLVVNALVNAGSSASNLTVSSVGPVSPNPRNAPLDSLDFTFAGAIDLESLDIGDLSLTLNGGANLLTSAQTISLVSGNTYRVGNLSGLTGGNGSYTLTVSAIGVLDLLQVAGVGSLSTTWTMDTVVPTVSIAAVSPNPRTTAVGSLDFTFSETINAGTLTLADLALVRNGAPIPWTAGQSIAFVSGTTWRLSGLAALTGADGTYALTFAAGAVQDPAGNANASGATTSWTADVTPPTVSLAPVSPNPRNTSVDSVDFTFSEAINTATLTLADLTFTRNGAPIAWTAGQSIAFVSGTTFRLNGLAALTASDGTYGLSVNTSGVTDALGNPGTSSASTSWVKDAAGPTVASFAPVSPNPRKVPVDTVDVTLSEAIDPASFNWQDLSLMLNSSSVNLITSSQTVTWISGTTWRIGNLSPLTATDGAYMLKVTANGLKDLVGNSGVTTSTKLTWTMDTLAPTSQVLPLPAEATSLSFTVSVSGIDPSPPGGGSPSGSLSFNVYVSTNGSPFVFWRLLKGANLSGTFTGQSNTTYDFRSIATDKAGNVEDKPPGTIDASTHLSDLNPPASSVTAVSTASSLFTVSMKGNEVGGGTLMWFDLYVSIDGGAAQWIGRTPAGAPNSSGVVTATAQYDSLSGTHSYRFYTIAGDSAGNIETAPSNGDKTVTYTRTDLRPMAFGSAIGFYVTKPLVNSALDAAFRDPSRLVPALIG